LDRSSVVEDAAAAVRGFLEFQSLMAGRPLTLPVGASARLGTTVAYEALRSRALTCRRCSLAEHRTQVVFSSGNPLSRLVLVGEAPGAEEDAVGEPFVGAAGRLLDKILGAIKLTRQDVCIINIVKCRPPRNRDPLPEEREACRPLLEGQLSLLQPRIVCALGRVAAQTLLGTEAPLGSLRGRWYHWRSAHLIATYHPAALLRNKELKAPTWKDVQKIQDLRARILQ
jgi:DNA polymerase